MFNAHVNVPDPRTVDWFLVRSPIPVLIIVFSYIYFVQHLGPKLMKKHSPFNLSTILMVYNVAQIVHNVWILSEVQGAWYINWPAKFFRSFHHVLLLLHSWTWTKV
uniref:Very-long-chain 3-oxoacyl-CoA synthase n=1 Tax=Timema tahoe TaxID=61484 RepID=A0A7R9FKI4_9NEOP|nr:unnamed protein product [Timema tahoe]